MRDTSRNEETSHSFPFAGPRPILNHPTNCNPLPQNAQESHDNKAVGQLRPSHIGWPADTDQHRCQPARVHLLLSFLCFMRPIASSGIMASYGSV